MQKIKWSPVNHGCKVFRWGNKENKKRLNKIFSNDITLYDNPVVEFVGVKLANQRYTCLVENIKYFEGSGESTTEPKEVVATAPMNAPDQRLSYLEVDVRRVIYIQSFKKTVNAAPEAGIKFQYTMQGRAKMIKKGIHPRCSIFITKNNKKNIE